MKINLVEEQIGVTKKNIRFYEEQGLLSPQRDPQNGYRDYSEQDVETLRKIKLLRQLDVPLEQIRRLQKGDVSLEDCMRKHHSLLSQRQKELDVIKAVCEHLGRNTQSYSEMDAEALLSEIESLEREGVHFVDTKKNDVGKKRWGPLIAASVVALFWGVMIGVMLWANTVDPIPLWILVFVIAIYAAMIVGVIIALVLRLKEIKGGELDEARKY